MLKLSKYKRIYIILLTYSVTTELLSTNWENISAEDFAVIPNNSLYFSEVTNLESNYINNNKNNQIFIKKPIDYSCLAKENINNLNKRKRDKETDITEKEQPKSSKLKQDPKCLSIGLNTKKDIKPTDEILETFIKNQKKGGDNFVKIRVKIQKRFKLDVSADKISKICENAGLHTRKLKKQVEWTNEMREYLIKERGKEISFDNISRGINEKFKVKTSGYTTRSEYNTIQGKIAKEKPSHK